MNQQRAPATSTPLPVHPAAAAGPRIPPSPSNMHLHLPTSPAGLQNPPVANSGHDGLIRMLLQPMPLPQAAVSAMAVSKPKPTIPLHLTMPVTIPSLPIAIEAEERTTIVTRSGQQVDRELSIVMLDHSYAKPYNWRPDSSTIIKPTRSIFISKTAPALAVAQNIVVDEPIDVVNETLTSKRSYDIGKATAAMNECARYANFASPAVKSIEDAEDWDEKISREGWTIPQQRMFNKVLKVLHADRLSRLAQDGCPNEPILRRLTVDRTAKRVRLILAGVFWDAKMTQWLHNILCDNLPREYLAAYLDVLQTLKAKIPSIVDQMVAGRTNDDKLCKVTEDGMRLLLKRKWDPTGSAMEEQKLKKLPTNPVIIVSPSGPTDRWLIRSARVRHWERMLSDLAQVELVQVPPSEREGGSTPVSPFLHQMVSAILGRIREVKKTSPERPVVLIGWGVGAAINCQVAAMETIAANVCLGFPMHTMDGIRGEADDPILELRSPVLFVQGQIASNSRTDDVEDMRERMRCPTGLVVVGGADDALRVSKHKKRMENITQCMVDKCIMDEVREFLVSILTAPPSSLVPPPQYLNTGSDHNMVNSRKFSPSAGRVRKRPNSQAPRRSRPNKTASTATTPTSAPSSAPSSAPVTPIGGPDEIQRARKMLELGGGPLRAGEAPGGGQTSQLMANSPLLSSALTSPTKQGAGSNVTKISLPAAASAPLSKLFPTATLPPPPPPPIGTQGYNMFRGTSVPTITLPTMPSSTPMVQQPPRTVVTAISLSSHTTLTTSKPVSSTSSDGGPIGQPQVAKTHATPPQPPPSGARLGLSEERPASSAMHALAVRKGFLPAGAVAGAAGTGSKDNLYIVALPPDQIKDLEASGLVHSASQMVALLGEKRAEVVGSSLKVMAAATGAASGGTSGLTLTNPKNPAEKHNVAEILASLSGLMPEPPSQSLGKDQQLGIAAAAIKLAEGSETTPLRPQPAIISGVAAKSQAAPTRQTAAILSSASGNAGRIVRVLQSPSTQAMTMANAAVSNTMRSRKQVFVMSGDAEGAGSAATDEAVLREDPTRAEDAEAKTRSKDAEYEQDILEEDVSDLDYVPHQKKPAKPNKPKGKKK